MKFEIHEIKGLSVEANAKISRSIQLAEHTVELQEWKAVLLKEKMTETDGLTNMEIMHMFFSGSDLLNKESDGDIDLFLTGYYKRFSKVIGYIIRGKLWHWINTKFINLFDESDLAGHLIHEYMHRMGFSHYGKKSTSVPYVYGNVTKKIAQKEIDNGNFKPS